MLKRILPFLLVALVVIQFIHPKRNKAAGTQSDYIGNRYPVPGNVNSILVKACNDCHSNNTVYPWYAYLQPVDWWMNKHIKNGKKKLNLDDYTRRNLRYQFHKMEEIIEMLKEGKMPLNSYTWIHKNARLTPDEKNILINWAGGIMDTMKAEYPIDSLVQKK